jgi:hypothetical protein
MARVTSGWGGVDLSTKRTKPKVTIKLVLRRDRAKERSIATPPIPARGRWKSNRLSRAQLAGSACTHFLLALFYLSPNLRNSSEDAGRRRKSFLPTEFSSLKTQTTLSPAEYTVTVTKNLPFGSFQSSLRQPLLGK